MFYVTSSFLFQTSAPPQVSGVTTEATQPDDSGFASQTHSLTDSMLAASSSLQQRDTNSLPHKDSVKVQLFRDDASTRDDSAFASFNDAQSACMNHSAPAAHLTPAMNRQQLPNGAALYQYITPAQQPDNQTMTSPPVAQTASATPLYQTPQGVQYVPVANAQGVSSAFVGQNITPVQQPANQNMTSPVVAQAAYAIPLYAMPQHTPQPTTGFCHSTPANVTGVNSNDFSQNNVITPIQNNNSASVGFDMSHSYHSLPPVYTYTMSANLRQRIATIHNRFQQGIASQVAMQLYQFYMVQSAEMESARMLNAALTPQRAHTINADYEGRHMGLIDGMNAALDSLIAQHGGLPLTGLLQLPLPANDTVPQACMRLAAIGNMCSNTSDNDIRADTSQQSMVSSDAHPDLNPASRGTKRRRNSSSARVPRPPPKRDQSCRFVTTFSDQAVAILSAWYDAHVEHPYPGRRAVTSLAQQCGMAEIQVRRWFGNRRAREKNVKSMAEISRRRMMHGYAAGDDEYSSF